MKNIVRNNLGCDYCYRDGKDCNNHEFGKIDMNTMFCANIKFKQSSDCKSERNIINENA